MNKKPHQSRWSIKRILLVAVLLALALAYWPIRNAIRHWQAGQALTRAFELANAGDLQAGEKSAWQAWKLSQKLPEGAVLAARLAVSQRDYLGALKYLESIPGSLSDLRPQLAIEALDVQEQAFESTFNLSEAERACKRLLELDAANLQTLHRLAKLLATCGRRDEAVPLVLKLVELNQVTDLLMLLARDSGAIRNEQMLLMSHRKFPTDPLPLVGLANQAMESDDFPEAIKYSEQALGLDSNYVPALVIYIRLLAETERWSDLTTVLNRLTGSQVTSVNRYAASWIARARLAEQLQDIPGAIRCYGEAGRRQPELRISTARLAVLLAQLGDRQRAEEFADYSRKLQTLRAAQDRILFAAAPENVQALLELVSHYEDCQRYWEARGWALWATRMSPNSPAVQSALSRNSLKTSSSSLTLVDYLNHPVGALVLEDYPLPVLRSLASPLENKPDLTTQDTHFAFADLSGQTGFKFEFCYGVLGEPQRFMYELTGGGVGVIDYDLDGWEDIVVPQGRVWPPSSDASGERLDMLFRNQSGREFKPLSLPLDIDGFGQGVACGDFNNDGFSDIYIAQIGNNRLLQNMGDGTFVDITVTCGLIDDSWTVSCVLADLNGDSNPDLYDVNYLQGEDLFSRICSRDGLPAQCSPFDFKGAPDACWLGDGQGGFRRITQEEIPVGRGLGAVAADIKGDGKLSLFIANDTDPNFLLSFETTESGNVLSESGITSGIAFNESGKAEGSMGIALGDPNSDGRMDLFVTNFLNETNTYYRNLGQAMFADATKPSGLDLPSIDVLGFGTQFLDANLDGSQELFVANGHVDDLRAHNRPYKMHAHLYTSNRERFTRVVDAGEYFKRELLGRAVAKIDWNRDFKPDLVVGHLQSPYALLTNQTALSRRPIALRLIGTKSSRDAVGTTVQLEERDREQWQQVTAGDGYEASNSKKLILGVADLAQAKLKINWPSGKTQTIEQLVEESELVIVEPVEP